MKKLHVGFCLSLGLALFVSAASAATISWTNTAGGNYSEGGNWQGGVPPGPSDGALFTNTATHTVTVDASVTNGASVFTASSGETTVSIPGAVQWVHTNNFFVGSSNQSKASVVLTGGGTLVAKWAKISGATNSAASLTLETGTYIFTNSANTGVDVGCANNNGNSSGTLVLADSGVLLMVTNGTGIALGGNGDSGTYSNNYGKMIMRGGTIRTTGLRLPFGNTSSADILIETGTIFNAGNTAVTIGQGGGPGTGTVVLASSGASLISTGSSASVSMVVGDKKFTVGTILASNGVVQSKDMIIGNLGTGWVSVENDANLMVLSNFQIGSVTGGLGTLNLSGQSLASAGILYLGDNGVGQMTMSDSATMIVSNNMQIPWNGTAHGLGTGVLVMASQNALLTVSNTLTVGANFTNLGSGTMIISNGTVRTRVLSVGQFSDGLVTLLDGSILQNGAANSDGLKLGNHTKGGTGTVVLAHANALISMPSNTLVLGNAANTSARLIISNGTVLVRDVQTGGSANSATNSVSEITILDGSLTTTNVTFQCSVGRSTTTRITLDHPNARLDHPNGDINVACGTNSYASLVMSNGALTTRSLNLGGYTTGNPPGQYGEVIMYNATGTLRNKSGTMIWLAGQPNCTGLMVMAHAGSLLDCTNNVLVGDAGDGTLLVSNGLFKAANITIASQTGSVGRMVISGGRVELTNTLTVGNRSSGSLAISGGEVTATNLVLIGVATNVVSTVELSGGTLSLYGMASISSFGGSSNLWLSGGTLAALKNFTNSLTTTLTNSPGPGLFTFSTVHTNTQSGGLTGPGGLAKAGVGLLRLTQVNDFTGETVVDVGTLGLVTNGSIDNSTSITVSAGATLNAALRTDRTLTLGAAQTLKGSGTVLGNVTNSGTVAPGASPGILSVVGDYNQTGTLAIELSGTTPGSGHDVLAVASNAVLGGTLTVTTPSFTPSGGQSFTVLTATAVSGTFATTNLPAGDWTVDYQADKVVLSLAGGSGPTVGPVTLTRDYGQSLHVLESALMTNSVNAGGGALTCIWVSATSSNSQPVSRSGGWVLYNASNTYNGTDQFNFRLANTNGDWAEATATVLVSAPETNTTAIASPAITNGGLQFIWAGIPGRTNQVDGATELAPGNWSNIGARVIDALGKATFFETNPPSPRYYRISE